MSLQLRTARARSQGRGMAGRPAMGDPGIFGGIGKLFKKGINVALSGNPLASIGGGVLGGLFGRDKLSRAEFQLATPTQRATDLGLEGAFRSSFVNLPTSQQLTYRNGGPQEVPGTSVVARPGVGGFLERVLPGGQSGYMAQTGIPPKGYHLNKTSYFLQDGTFVPAQSRWVKNRRRNPLNPRALSRSIGRIKSFKKAVDVARDITVRDRCRTNGRKR